MRTLLFICLIISMVAYGIRILFWLRTTILLMSNPENELLKQSLDSLRQSKFTFIVGGIEHLIIFGSLLASTLIIF